MKKFLLLFIWLFFVTGCQPKTTEYVHYHNERFGFELDYSSFMTMDPPPENGDGIRCHGKGMDLVAYGCQDLHWMKLDDLTPNGFDSYQQDGIFYVKSSVDIDGTVHYTKTARFPNTDNGNVIFALQISYPQGQDDLTIINHILNSFCFRGNK